MGSILTVAYSARFVWGAFAIKPGDARRAPPKDFSPGFLAAPVVLAVAHARRGLRRHLAAPRGSMSYAEAVPRPAPTSRSLALWHGFTPALGLSVAVHRRPAWRCSCGASLSQPAQHAIVDRLRLPDAERAYYGIMRGIDRLSVEVTGRTQRGSLPVYLGMILSC